MTIPQEAKTSPTALTRINTVLPEFGAVRMPVQPTPELERLYRKQRLAASYRLFARQGFDFGGAGHITVRDPEHLDQFWVNPFGVPFRHICVSELMLVNHEGEIVVPPAQAAPRLNRAAFAIHSELHRARPDVNAAAHSHSFYGKTFATLGRRLDPISQDAAIFFEDHVVFEAYSGVVRDLSEGRAIAEALGRRNTAILQHHGLLTVGQTVESAVWRYLAMEEACRVQLLAESVGVPKQMAPELARQATRMGTEFGGVYAFQPYWESITAEEPDLFN